MNFKYVSGIIFYTLYISNIGCLAIGVAPEFLFHHKTVPDKVSGRYIVELARGQLNLMANWL